MNEEKPPRAAGADPAAALFRLANELRQGRRNLEAVQAYDRALAIRSEYPEALNNRGNALRDLGRYQEALASYDRALCLRPTHERALNNRGNVLRDLGRHEEALESYDRALALKADYAEALINRGNVLRDLKRFEEALASYDRALDLRPESAAALGNRGAVLLDMNRCDEALEACDRVVLLEPANAGAHYNRGNVLLALKRHEDALAAYARASTLAPGHAEAWNNQGNVLLFLRKVDQALASYSRALALRPDDAEFLCNKGHALQTLGRPFEALESYARALASRPDYADALYAYAQVLLELKRNDEAIDALEKLHGIDPDYARGTLVALKRSSCDWTNLDGETAALIKAACEGKRIASPFSFLAISDSPSVQLLCAKSFLGDSLPFVQDRLWKGERYRHEKIRIAYLSADFRDHPGAYLMAGLFEAHDRSRFETTAVSWGRAPQSAIRRRLIGAFDRFLEVDLASDREVATKIRELEIDIAVNRMGYTRSARTAIVALRPAPVQVSFLGYPGTMAADCIDYLIADKIVIPDEDQIHYSEKIVTLPDTYQCNDSKRPISEHTPSRAEAGLPETGFVFCSFHNTYKITPAIFESWMRLLREIEGSVLWLFESNAAAVRNLRKEAQARGVAPERLIFAKSVQLQDHLARHRLADLWLDTLPYNGHTAVSDALWAGLPVLTCTGTSFAGRVATSLLHAVGMKEMAANSLEEYESLALKLARDADALSAIKAKLARNRETYPLFDTNRFCRHLEAAYTTMWERSMRGEPPERFAVAPGA
jgi:predicted O-linked N-acetylglucosamine transferase (SPINDLY family)